MDRLSWMSDSSLGKEGLWYCGKNHDILRNNNKLYNHYEL